MRNPKPHMMVRPRNNLNFPVFPFSRFKIDNAIVNDDPMRINVFKSAKPLFNSPAEWENNSKLEFRSTMNAPKKPVKNMISEARKIHIANFPCGTLLTGSCANDNPDDIVFTVVY
jgi:hypothetical protein